MTTISSATDYGYAAFKGASLGNRIAHWADKAIYVATGRWIGDAVCALPPVGFLLEQSTRPIAYTAKKLAHWQISRSVQGVVNRQVKQALDRSCTTPVTGQIPEGLVDFIQQNPLAQHLAGKGEAYAKAQIANHLSNAAMLVLDPLIVQQSAKATGRMVQLGTASILKGAFSARIAPFAVEQYLKYTGSSADASTLLAGAVLYANTISNFKIRAGLTLGLGALYTIPVIQRRSAHKAEKDALKKDLSNYLYETVTSQGLVSVRLENFAKSVTINIADQIVESKFTNLTVLRESLEIAKKKINVWHSFKFLFYQAWRVFASLFSTEMAFSSAQNPIVQITHK